jgi:hypothetical protein
MSPNIRSTGCLRWTISELMLSAEIMSRVFVVGFDPRTA